MDYIECFVLFISLALQSCIPWTPLLFSAALLALVILLDMVELYEHIFLE